MFAPAIVEFVSSDEHMLSSCYLSLTFIIWKRLGRPFIAPTRKDEVIVSSPPVAGIGQAFCCR